MTKDNKKAPNYFQKNLIIGSTATTERYFHNWRCIGKVVKRTEDDQWAAFFLASGSWGLDIPPQRTIVSNRDLGTSWLWRQWERSEYKRLGWTYKETSQ